jgi:hypothetical protein
VNLGVLNEETLSSTLREISQRRRSGVLGIAMRDGPVRVFFHHGKIVEALVEGMPATLDVAASLERAGLAVFPEDYGVGSYAELFRDLSKDRHGRVDVPPDVFRRVVKHRILDRMYQLDLQQGARFEFNAEFTDIERDFAPAIPVGQLLLDLVALKTDGPTFEELVPPEAIISGASLPQGTTFSEDEQIIFDLIGDGVKREYLFAKTMLSRFHFQDAILAMFNQGIIAVRQGSPDINQLAGALDSAIDSAFGSQEAPPEPKPQPLVSQPVRTVVPSKTKLIGERLLSSAVVPEILAIGVVIAALVAPWFLWGEIANGF